MFEPLESRHLLSATVIEVTTTQDLVDPNDAFISLREAVLMANASPEDNEIILPAGTYTLTRQGANENGGLTGDLDVTANGALRIVGAGASETTIDAAGLYVPALFSGDRIMEIAAQADVTIEGIGFTGGSTRSGPLLISDGGAIRTLGNLRVSEAIFSANTAGSYGGAVYAGGASWVSITASQFLANSAQLDGGGLAVDGRAVVNVDTSVFEGNTASRGGALYASAGSLVVHQSQLRENRTSSDGGGVYVRGAVDFALVDSVIADNVGGGVEISSSRPVSIQGTTISGNEGGGIDHHSSGLLTISNSTISGNHSVRTGGIISRGNTLILNSTITLNRALWPEHTGAGGILVSSDGTVTMHNTLVVGNLVGISPEAFSSSDIVLNGGWIAPESSFNLIGDPNSAGGLANGVNGNLVGDGLGGVLDVNTVLDTTLTDNGGPTLTHALLSASPAVNAGNPVLNPESPQSDQRGAGYARVTGGNVDIGAFEYGSVITNVVSGRHVFYNNSSYDGKSADINPFDVFAIDPSKQALRPDGSLADATNVTSYSRGINGVMVDLAGSHPNVTASDFIFRVGSTNDPDSWADAPAPAAIQVLAGQGLGWADRVVITWPDGAIKNTYLQVIVAANENTGLALPDVFFFGNRVGDSFNTQPPASFVTGAADELAARNASMKLDLHVTSPVDFDKNGQITAADMLIARNNPGVLPRIQIAPPAPAVPLAQPAAAEAFDRNALVSGLNRINEAATPSAAVVAGELPASSTLKLEPRVVDRLLVAPEEIGPLRLTNWDPAESDEEDLLAALVGEV